VLFHFFYLHIEMMWTVCSGVTVEKAVTTVLLCQETTYQYGSHNRDILPQNCISHRQLDDAHHPLVYQLRVMNGMIGVECLDSIWHEWSRVLMLCIMLLISFLLLLFASFYCCILFFYTPGSKDPRGYYYYYFFNTPGSIDPRG